MPFLIRIILQRLLTWLLGLLAFLGISPNVGIPTQEQVDLRLIEQKQIVEEILNTDNKDNISESIVSIIDEAAQKIDQKRQEIENSPVQETNLENKTEYTQTAPTNPPAKTTTPPPQTKSVEQTINTITHENMTSLADVVVNIICTQQKNGFTTASAGSGVLISPQGVVITNAHIAQFFILEDSGYPINCAIYRENIPTYGYKADIFYISKKWFKDNYKIISQESPYGTGERDYALLYITGNTNPVLQLPSSFSYAKFNLDNKMYQEGKSVRAAGFPGTPLSIFDLTKSGSLKTDNTEITRVATFSGDGVDIFSTGVTSVAARGASGGGIFNKNNLIGITVTTSKSGSGSKINALTTRYINNQISDEDGHSLNDLITGDVQGRVSKFQKENLDEMAELLVKQMN